MFLKMSLMNQDLTICAYMTSARRHIKICELIKNAIIKLFVLFDIFFSFRLLKKDFKIFNLNDFKIYIYILFSIYSPNH